MWVRGSVTFRRALSMPADGQVSPPLGVEDGDAARVTSVVVLRKRGLPVRFGEESRGVRVVIRACIAVVVLGCVLGAIWLFRGSAVSDAAAGKAGVVGAIAQVLALVVAVVWPSVTRVRRRSV